MENVKLIKCDNGNDQVYCLVKCIDLKLIQYPCENFFLSFFKFLISVL